MAKFVENAPVVQAEPQVKVEVDPRSPLQIGANRFRLVVVDDSGNESEPAFLEVIVEDRDRPTAVLDVINPNGQPVRPVIAHGESFVLSGERSKDKPPGRIKEYRFTLVGRG